MQEAAIEVAAPPVAPVRQGIRPSVVATGILVMAADVLIISVRPGLGWFVFAASLAGVLAAMAARRSPGAALLALAVGIVGALPLIEASSFPGTLAAFAGLGGAALLAAGLFPSTMEAIPGVIIRFVPTIPYRLPMDFFAAFGSRPESNWARKLGGRLIGWIVPLVFLAIFAGLFLAGNPVMDFLAAQIDLGAINVDPVRVFFWLVFAAAIWALLQPRLMTLRTISDTLGGLPAIPAPHESGVFGRAAITRSLVVFNAIFAVQTLMDLTYLWAGAALPEGMTYADFAHRGAAPLIITALLSAAFVLAAMRPDGPGIGSSLIRRLVYVWIAQNVLLCISAMRRLGLYVEAYSLTEFRVVAGIWIGLVAMGLVLILLRIALRRSNSWLVAANIASVLVTFYATAWIDVPARIASFNVEHSEELSGGGTALDIGYFADLGPTAIPALDTYIAAVPASDDARRMRVELVAEFIRETSGDWRSWTHRNHRLGFHLDAAAP